MRPRLEALVRTTTFRLALIQAGVVLTFVVALLGYVYIATAGQLIRDSDEAVVQEYASLERAYAEGGMRRLNQEVIERAARQGPMLYVLANADGTVVAGDFQHLGRLPGDRPEFTDFSFDRIDDAGAVSRGRARGRLGRLLNGPILMVARDLGDSAVIAGRITRVLWTVAILGFVLSVASGLIASWLAARRAEALSVTARDVMAGDLSRRAPARAEGDEFDELASDLNAMLDRLEQLVQTTRTAGDAIAHDLRSPLTRFKQRLESALDEPPDAENDREALKRASVEADNLLDMFAKVLRVARVESASNWRFEPVDATDILKELVEFYQPAAEEIGLTFTSSIEEGLAVRGDRGLVTQALSNLIENAMKYTPNGGRIDVRAAKRRDGRVELSVSDDGPGVPPSERQRVMERFVRLEAARSTPGVGLGLSLVVAIARLHKGNLTLRDGLGPSDKPGLCASLVLPASEPVRAAAVAP